MLYAHLSFDSYRRRWYDDNKSSFSLWYDGKDDETRLPCKQSINLLLSKLRHPPPHPSGGGGGCGCGCGCCCSAVTNACLARPTALSPVPYSTRDYWFVCVGSRSSSSYRFTHSACFKPPKQRVSIHFKFRQQNLQWENDVKSSLD